MDHDAFQENTGGGDGGTGGGDPALEARIVAWALGEASAFEAAELERLVAAQPELALFKRRIEAVHGLLGETALIRKSDTLRLGADRRTRLLKRLGAAEPATAAPAGDQPAVLEPARPVEPRRPRWWVWLVFAGPAVASVVLVGLFVTVNFSRHFGDAPPDLEFMRENAARITSGDERALRLQAVEEAKAMMEERRKNGDKEKGDRAVFGMQLEAIPLDMPAQSLGDPDLEAPEAVAHEWSVDVPVQRRVGAASGPVPTSAGAIAIPLSRGLDAPKPVSDAMEIDEGEVVTLSPFEIRGGAAGAGYEATQTLAGTRIRTEAKDLGSSVSVVNQQFLQDIAAGVGGPEANYAAAAQTGGASQRADDSAAAETAWSAGFESAANAEGTGFEGGYLDVGLQRPNPSMTLGVPADGEKRQEQRHWAGDQDKLQSALQQPLIAGQTGAPSAPPPPSSVPASEQPMEMRRVADQISKRRDERQIAQAAAREAQATGKLAADVKAADQPAREKKPAPPPPAAIDEAHASKEPVSTFSLHVSDASFRLAQAALARGALPNAATVRPEEFYNAFDYGDPSPSVGDKVACRIEQAAHPFLQQRNLVRIAMKVASTGRGAGQPLRLTVLLDTSGSMEREDRAAAVRRAIEVLASLLGPDDRVTLIGFARQPRLLAEAVRGDEAARLAELAAQTPADGGTNVEEALRLAGELARRHFAANAQNRVVLLTDGAANLGNADPEQLATGVEALRAQGIAFDACGVGTDGLDDEILEALTRRGDGRYYVLDSPEDADAGFARQLAGAFRPAAMNVKVQVRFNPARVGAYRLLGFEKHRLREEDFRNDKVDAAELAAEEAAVAVYQVEVLPEGEGELGDVYVRFRDMAGGGAMVERMWTIAHDARARSFDRAAPTLQLAGTAALLAEELRGGALADQVDLGELAPVVNALRGHFAANARVQQLAAMFEQVRRITGR